MWQLAPALGAAARGRRAVAAAASGRRGGRVLERRERIAQRPAVRRAVQRQRPLAAVAVEHDVRPERAAASLAGLRARARRQRLHRGRRRLGVRLLPHRQRRRGGGGVVGVLSLHPLRLRQPALRAARRRQRARAALRSLPRRRHARARTIPRARARSVLLRARRPGLRNLREYAPCLRRPAAADGDRQPRVPAARGALGPRAAGELLELLPGARPRGRARKSGTCSTWAREASAKGVSSWIASALASLLRSLARTR